jgi:hypothetical protein
MNPRLFTVGAVLAASSAALPVSVLADCEAQSGPNRAALVELYTSEGCSSCPPADQTLSHLKQALDPAVAVVPLALHVDYWDYLGWTDPFAQADFAMRQRWLADVSHRGVVYTPEFFVSGTELDSWQKDLRHEVLRVNACPAEAQIQIEASLDPKDELILSAQATARSSGDRRALYVAVAESGLLSQVTRGENGGATLAHDHVVRAWVGPVPLAGGTGRVHREIALPASWNRAQLEIVGFVEDGRSGRILQAVEAGPCFGL